MSRTRSSVQQLRDRPHADVLIIGGGINGIATFRDLALQGVDVALVERGDFVSGASSASSHMIHGGIRYLENGEFRLVKESVTERNRLLRAAPHYVKPLETTIPIYSTFSGILSAPFRLLVTHGRGKARERGAALIKMGLMMYDTFSRDGGQVPRHRFLGRKRSLAELPHMNPSLSYTATYFDASMHDPERLALDVLHDGEVAGGDRARAANYMPAVNFTDGGVRLRDEDTGEEFDFTARVIVNTSGPWTDLTNAALGTPTEYMGGTKGSHIVLDNPELLAATGGREIFFEHSDGRIVLIYPLKDRVLVGTTDIDADPREAPVCTSEEVDYFFDLVAHVFPTITVDRSQIVYTFSGIRPLPRHDDTTPGFVSRDYRIVASAVEGVPLLSLVGGKWTTFRALAEHLSNEVLELLGASRTQSTETLSIGGGTGFPRSAAERTTWLTTHSDGRESDRVAQLLSRYGTRAEELLRAEPETAHALPSLPGYTAEELAHLASTEQVVHLDDLLLRRTSLAFVGGLTVEKLQAAAEAIAPALSWGTDRIAIEVARMVDLLRESHRIDTETGAALLDA
ncbi:glycerol-3-phosphate dehydrogenase [Leucobacter luti]|uniref:glycerol-3-phosphate dehydrogenase/oxidase n=1 Tax=Leucobacter luti TaxID=340320 RepID=UPI001045A1AD|nr:glycerol-3-phosphate dehydrogenase/oxidase [Leucobacter luti]MCW2289106.1 glycerol-3-phosphate dehydrogenase [Leucobacter luti]TCK35495.1 glycerol-3-phosphate dehydrogenase [Leucobacter luti]